MKRLDNLLKDFLGPDDYEMLHWHFSFFLTSILSVIIAGITFNMFMLPRILIFSEDVEVMAYDNILCLPIFLVPFALLVFLDIVGIICGKIKKAIL